MKAILVRLANKVVQTTRPVPRSLCLALLALLALGTPQVQAAIAVVDSTGASANSTAVPISLSFPTTGGNVLVVNLSYKGPNGVYPVGPLTLDWVTSGSVTQTMTRVVQAANTATKAFGSSIYYLWNPIADASGTVSGALPTTTPAYTAQIISAFTLSGVDTNTLPIAATNIDNTTANFTVSTTNAAGGPLGGFAALCSGTAATGNGSGFSASASGGTPVNWLSSAVVGGIWYQGYIPNLVTTTTNFTCTYAAAAGRSHIVAAIFTPAVSTSTTPTLIGQNATAMTTTTATLGAIVVTNGTSTITNYGIVYAPTAVNPAPTVGGASVTQLVKGTTQTLGAFTTNATGLTPGTQYSYAGYAQNSSGIGYSDVGTFYALTNEPTVQATGVSFSSAERSAFTFSWTRGNGANCLVLLKADSAVTGLPVDGTTYTADANFTGAGSVIGTSAKVVYLGSGNSVTVSNLTIGTTYYVAVFEVNGAGGSENYLTNSPATGNQTATGNTYYSVGTGLSPSTTSSWTNSLGASPANFTSGDTFIIQNGHSLTPPGSWTVSGGATLIINSGGTLDMQYDLNKLFLGGSFVNNGTLAKSIDTGTPPSVNFINFGNANTSTNFTSSLTVGTNYNVSVLAIGGGGSSASAINQSNSLPVQGGGGGGGASAYSTNLVLQAGNAYQVTVGANGIRPTIGTGFGQAGNAGGASSFGGGFLTTIIANGGAGGSVGDTNGAAVGGAGGAAGSSGNAANFAGGSAVSGGGGGGGGADDVAAGNPAGSGIGGTSGSGSLATGGAGGTIAANATGTVGTAPGGGGAGANWTSGAGKAGSAGGVGWVTVQLISPSTAANTFVYKYQSRASGDWNDFNTWSVDRGSGFVNATNGETPNAGHQSVVVLNSHTVTVAAAAVTVNLTVNTGGTLTVSGGGLSVNRLTGQTNANNLTVNGTLNLATANALNLGNNTTNLIAAGAVLNHAGGSTVVNYGTGVQMTINGTYNQNVNGSGVIPVATWAAASTCQINSTFTNSTTGNIQLNYGQNFGNFIWNAQGDVTNQVYRMANGAITNWAVGNLTISNTAGTPARLELALSQVLGVSVTNLTMTGGSFRAGGGNVVLTVNGPLAISAGAFDLGGAINALGDVSITGSTLITGGSPFSFAKAGAQAWTTTLTNNLTAPKWIVNSGTALSLGSASRCVVSDLTVNGGLTVTGNSTLLVNGANAPTTNNSGTITVASGSTLGGNGAIGASVTLSAGAMATNTFAIDTNNVPNGQLTTTNALALNGNTIFVSTGIYTLNVGDYVLITNTIGGITGSFGSVVISGAGLASGTTGTVVTTANAVKLHVALAAITTVPTTTLLVSSANPSTNGSSVTFTATVQTNSVTVSGATSNYVFSVDGTPVATNAVTGGSASYASSALTVGSHTIQAIYLGDASYLASTNSLTQVVTNFPPVANPDTATTYWNVPVTISPLANDSDPLGLPLTLVSVSPSSGSASINNSTNVLFTPATGASTTATLNYVITNGAGGSASSIITVTVTNPPVPRFTSAKVVGTNFVATGTNGAPNGTYNMLTATNVAQSLATWTAVLTNTFDGSGNFSNNIPTNSTLPRSFYRIQQ